MRRLLVATVFLLALLVPALAQATTYYISPTGSNANNGLTTGTPWLTFAYALDPSRAGCGHTLILMDGTYTIATHGALIIVSKSCTVNTVFLVQAQNQRAAWLQGNGLTDVLFISASAHVTVDGLRVTSAENTGAAGNPCNVVVNGSNNIILRNMLVSYNNRWKNTHLMIFISTTNSRVEDSEFYSFHRYAVIFSNGATQNVVRRIYCNSRGYGSIPGGAPNGGGPNRGDSCVQNYPGGNNTIENVISEGNGGGFAIEADGAGDNVKFYGNISLNDGIGVFIRTRGSGIAMQPENTIIANTVVIGATGVGFLLQGVLNTQCTNCMAMLSPTNIPGFLFSVDPGLPGSGVYSIFMTNSLSVGNGYGVNVNNFPTWTQTNVNAYGNIQANYLPSSSTNYMPTNPPTATDPVLGTCRVWIPDASPMKGAGAGGADIGANILYRYVDGVLTTVPLWDPTTGDFPRGATVAGVNDIAGSSLFDVDNRLNVNANGCSFPASYSGTNPPTPPENPSTYISSTGTTSTTHDHPVDAGMDSLTVCVALYDAEGNVGSVTGATSGGEALTLLKRQVATPAYRAAELWGKLTPTSGTRSIVVSTTGAVDAMVTTSIETDAISAYGGVAGASNTSETPSVTVATNTSETIIDCLSAYSGTALTAGPNQTLQMDTAHGSFAQRGATSTQSGNDGGLMSHTLGISASQWVLAVVSLLPTTPDAPPSPTPVLNQTKFRWHGLYGTEAGPEVKPYAAAPMSTNITAHPTGMARLRIEITATDNTSTPVGLVLYCRKNADGYTPALDTFGSNVFRLLGGGIFAEIPGSLTTTTCQLTVDGNCTAGAMIRSEPAVFDTPSLTTGKHTEMEWVLVLNAAAGDTVDCRVHKDSGGVINTYTVTPRITIAPLAAGF